MNDQAERLDQADEEILASMLSDEALEAAAGTERRAFFFSVTSSTCQLCC